MSQQHSMQDRGGNEGHDDVLHDLAPAQLQPEGTEVVVNLLQTAEPIDDDDESFCSTTRILPSVSHQEPLSKRILSCPG
jgi:hypothetical protein